MEISASALLSSFKSYSHHYYRDEEAMLYYCILILVAMLGATAVMEQIRKMWMRKIELDGWIQVALKERDSQVHKVLMNIADDDTTITEKEKLLSAAETRDLILSGKLDPRKNIAKIAKRCRTYGRAAGGANAVTVELYDEAYAAAEVWEKKKHDYRGGLFHQPSATPPPLLGVPLAVKDAIAIKDTFSTGGLACRLDRKDKEDALIIKALKLAGGIPICKGNVVQGMGISESYNRIWGRSRNPWDLTRSPGGSSGGDAALVAMGCVPLSVSADGAGSIRIPASCCGVVGFKPTPARMTFKNCMRPKKDDRFGASLAIPATIGPMARTVEDCALFMKAVFSPEVYRGDRNIPPLDFNEKAYSDTRKLKIGYFMTDDWMEPCPTGKRAMKEAIAALEKQGHTCVPFTPPTDGWHHNKLFVGITAAEGNMRSYRDALEGEMMIPDYAPLVGISALPNWMRKIAKLILPKRIGHLLSCGKNGGLSAYELWDLTADLLKMKEQWSDAFSESGVDAVVFPALPIPAIRHGRCGKIMSVTYMFISNLLFWPSGTLPVTTIRDDEQHYRSEDLPKDHRDMMSGYIAQEMIGSAGLPISVSVMTPSFEDELCLRVMKVIEKGVNFQARPTAFEEETFE